MKVYSQNRGIAGCYIDIETAREMLSTYFYRKSYYFRRR
jgi:hypothetical protein